MDENRRDIDVDVEEVRGRLEAARGPEYWRSLEELAGTPAFREWLHREFPRQASVWTDEVSRRGFLGLMGASLALAGLSGCMTPKAAQKIVPYIEQPEKLTPGIPRLFATAMEMGGDAIGLLAISREGRPIKLEGNPDHPSSRGATDPFAQASLLTLYDPDRSQTVTHMGRPADWEELLAAMTAVSAAQRTVAGTGLRILTGTVTSPTLGAQIRRVLTAFPQAKWHQYEPVNRDNVRAASIQALGRDAQPLYDFMRADVILSLDADFLLTMPGRVRYARDFIDGRRVAEHDAVVAKMNRLYVAESGVTVTGAKADHRIPLRPSEMESFARAVSLALESPASTPATNKPANPDQWAALIAADLRASGPRALVLAGPEQPPAVQLLAHAMNTRLGAVGSTLHYAAPNEEEAVDNAASIRALADDMAAGRVQALIILGANPAYNAPADLDFARKLDALPPNSFTLHVGLYNDETANHCQWHCPEAHYLESWSDTRALDGTVSLIQPLIEPLYQGRTAAEVLAVLLSQPRSNPRDIVQDYWRAQHPGPGFDAFWRKSLRDGIVGANKPPTNVIPSAGTPASGLFARTQPAAGRQQPAAGSQAGAAGVPQSAIRKPQSAIELLFRPDPTIYDGRFANNGWLQELPKPITKLTWDNAVLLSPATAKQLGVVNEGMVELEAGGRKVSGPVWIQPGHADGCATVHLGYGRTRAGRVGDGQGFNAYLLRTSDSPWSMVATVRKTGRTQPLATTQHQHAMEGGEIIRAATLKELRERPDSVRKVDKHPSLLPNYRYDTHRWGMTIDLTACVGCNACVVGCQAENNIPVVGKDQVSRGRAMHWIRVDAWYQGAPEDPRIHFQPVPCMQCEKAPCELVCPVGATVHSAEGLNEMVYNRCIGTRYCSNNCPYKVRRFNFLQFSDRTTPSLQLMYNPEVTLRTTGVMEKCTYCVQRIEKTRIAAEREDRPIRTGEIQTACQQACPTRAIEFGDLNDPDCVARRLKESVLNYELLGELNTLPRTTYLAGVRNPNPALEGA
jgi:MoCo/4Fe-4S cofactor protein with predicted Tat translocation signal